MSAPIERVVRKHRGVTAATMAAMAGALAARAMVIAAKFYAVGMVGPAGGVGASALLVATIAGAVIGLAVFGLVAAYLLDRTVVARM